MQFSWLGGSHLAGHLQHLQFYRMGSDLYGTHVYELPAIHQVYYTLIPLGLNPARVS